MTFCNDILRNQFSYLGHHQTDLIRTINKPIFKSMILCISTHLFPSPIHEKIHNLNIIKRHAVQLAIYRSNL